MDFIRWSWENYWLMWRKSFDFRGVTPRNQYWAFFIVQMVLIVGPLLFFGLKTHVFGQGEAITVTPWEPFFQFLFGIYFIFFIGSFVPLLSSQVRRIRDASGRGLWILLGLIPYAGGLVLTVITLYPTRKSLK